MLKVDLVCVGRLKEEFWRKAAAEYLKRLKPYLSLKVYELPDRSEAGVTKDALLAAEATEIENCLKKQQIVAPLVLLDIQGQAISSVGWAERLARQEASGHPRLALLVGGSQGVAERVRQLADERVSFGPITLSHNLARVVLLEQLYRACRIKRGEPYHK